MNVIIHIPKSLKEEFKKYLGKYVIDVNYWHYHNEDEFLKDIYFSLKRFKAITYLLNKYNPDLF